MIGQSTAVVIPALNEERSIGIVVSSMISHVDSIVVVIVIISWVVSKT
jgi:hypothetical protein